MAVTNLQTSRCYQLVSKLVHIASDFRYSLFVEHIIIIITILTGLAQNVTVQCNGKMDCSSLCIEEIVSNCYKMDNASEHRNNTSSKSCNPCSQSGGLKLLYLWCSYLIYSFTHINKVSPYGTPHSIIYYYHFSSTIYYSLSVL